MSKISKYSLVHYMKSIVPLLLIVTVLLAFLAPFSVAHAAIGSFPGCPELQEGSTGACVQRLQRDLGGLTVDEDFGPLTLQATVNFQHLYGLTPDGIVGPKTAMVLQNVERIKLQEPTPADYPPSFNPGAAAAWAVANPTVPETYPKDPCTEFVSKSLAAGGLPYDGEWYPDSDAIDRYINSGNSSLAWVNATALKDYIIGHGWASIIALNMTDETSALMARPGDLLYYTWQEKGAPKVHLTIVTGLSGDIAQITEQTGDSKIPFAINETWDEAHVVNDQRLINLNSTYQLYLIHWRETPI